MDNIIEFKNLKKPKSDKHDRMNITPKVKLIHSQKKLTWADQMKAHLDTMRDLEKGTLEIKPV